MAALGVIGLFCGTASAAPLPSFDAVRSAWRASDWIVLDRHGEPIQRLRADFGAWRGDWVALTDVSPAFRDALLVSEDKRFYAHSGVDWRGVAAAAWGNLWNTRTRGASTVTMQLAGLLDDDRRSGTPRSVFDKVEQTVDALALERSWRKDQILEAYLNRVPFRGELIGIDALSQTLFGKAPSGLDRRESAVAAALIRAPNAGPARVAARACQIEQALDAACDGLRDYTRRVLERPSRGRADVADGAEGLAPHFSRRLLSAERPAAGTRVTSSLDAPLQRFATRALRTTLTGLSRNGTSTTGHIADGGVIVLDNASGEVLAWVGSAGRLSSAPEVDTVAALRQAGSTLKPFLYASAFDQRRLTAASLLHDSPIGLPTGGGLYVPQNYDKDFHGWVSVRHALASSLNIPAVRTLVMVGAEPFARQLRALGLPLEHDGDYYGFSLALGSADVTLASLTNAYRALANGGVAGPLSVHPPLRAGVPAPRAPSGFPAPAAARVFSPAASFVVSDILADRNARLTTFGIDSVLTTPYYTAVKTGTSKDMRDNWTVGFSRRYTVGVWVGNADGSPMWDVSGVTGAGPVWRQVQDYLQRRGTGGNLPANTAPAAPAGVEQVAVRFEPALEPARDEWFLTGTAQPVVRLASIHAPTAPRAGTAGARIAEPVDGTIFALDPDIPPANQRITFVADGIAPAARSALRWRVDGQPIVQKGPARWLPWPGRHRLALLDAKGQTLDEIGFEVRGAGVKPVAARPSTAASAPGRR
ncbi:penicillin-binding protein 1C [Chitinasiproducens palmae]|uniref:penicillin-binding protein 1C n=1 Tax=Chitinasiproducens palmae TaxID=1770053 RepID=UPI000B870681|nr:penicillin-binding protein 1C [Chitinasiproducens palmae]